MRMTIGFARLGGGSGRDPRRKDGTCEARRGAGMRRRGRGECAGGNGEARDVGI